MSFTYFLLFSIDAFVYTIVRLAVYMFGYWEVTGQKYQPLTLFVLATPARLGKEPPSAITIGNRGILIEMWLLVVLMRAFSSPKQA